MGQQEGRAKSKVALAALKNDRTIAQLAEQFDVHPNQITSWKEQLLAEAADVFGRGGSTDGKGAWRDNVFVERFWRTIKYEEVYLRAYDGVEEARQQSAATSPSATQGDLTQPLTAAPRIKPTLTRCRSARQRNPRPMIHLTTRNFVQ